MDSKERTARYRARRRGEHAPKLQPGPKKGYKQKQEHIEKRTRWGPEHPNWKGDSISERAGRSRALRRYKDAGTCRACRKEPAERHHIDGDTRNNAPSNIAFIC